MSLEIKISVRDLVEFLLRSGDLDERSMGASEEAMLEGARMHRKLQREEGPEYTAEVPLSVCYELQDCARQPGQSQTNTAPSGESQTGPAAISVIVEGRADGIFRGCDPEKPILGEEWTIDEIKTTYRKLSKIREPEPVHLAQAMCYAYIYAMQNQLDTIRVRMTYCSLADHEVRRFTYEYSREEIAAWFDGVMKEYSRWARMELDWKAVRDESLAELAFPFSYRPGQKELAVHVYHTICHGRKLFLEAPTGTGKTISVVFPALKAMGEGKADRLFYFTAKTVTGRVAWETFSILREKGMHLKCVQLTAKDKICPMESRVCTPEACPRAKGHFDRVNEALYDLLTREEAVGRDVLCEYGEKYCVCPFELGLDVSLFADAVIGDYNYLFDPHARLKRFFAEGKGRSRYLFLVDEAHNLVDRGREMYSASLSREEIRTFRSAVREAYPSLWRKLGRLIAAYKPYKEALEDMPEKKGERVLYTDEIDLAVDAAYKVMEEMQTILQDQRRGTGPAGGEASILFSATLLPIQYYKRLLGGKREDYEVYARSSFDPEKLGLFIAGDVTSRYRMRDTQQYDRIAACIHNAVSQRHGNYMVFFPSYRFMEKVLERYEENFPGGADTALLVQRPQMTEEERHGFLERFDRVSDVESLLGFCVLGGIFSEGIDLQKDRLIGVMIVGTGFPQVCAERELLKQYFDEQGENGFDYAYRFPGMNKVLQAAGRVIRTAQDVGVVVLMDERFCSGSYRRLFPAEWNGSRTTDSLQIGDKIARFWDEWL